ncbi:uncharacterized protein K452DRAFT_274471 [Aplosporella prunicola CBS 121167]|uniref:PPP4R2-domain-containing protein n=1 Tax=Aplosporella prunicola CBS 121167 TaxID=1176127 RepID=A0A6A6B7A7_9PEZI|nr:uncharacterized protein K452DRAFT_274471 [Aplosporella prunicola CBS 121167]KAF2139920.1 hypothetical protein K452DRAFT_274471 [Aplosporella prunicola CBS 121167]
MLSGEQLLEGAARDGSLAPSEWPRALEFLLPRLDHIVHHDFPATTLPPPPAPSSQDSLSADKENAPPSPPQADGEPSLPPELRKLHAAVSTTLSNNFANEPPHTIQRLSELVLRPKQHYRFLPSYLRALDRVVSVSSTTAVFPLPQAAVPASSSVLNGMSSGVATNPAAVLGSDESLGGALLTPIPWLRADRERTDGAAGSARNQSELVRESTEMVDGPNGAGRIETVSVINGMLGSTPTASTMAGTPPTTAASSNVPSTTSDALREQGAVTQGELLRQEQEAGVVPVGQTTPRRGLLSTAAVTGGTTEPAEESNTQDEPPEEHPHARGPEEIGAEDMGPQDRRLGGGIDLEAAVGRPAVKSEEERTETKEGDALPEGKEEEMEDVGADMEPAPSSTDSEVREAKRVKTKDFANEKDTKKEADAKLDKGSGGDKAMTDASDTPAQ